MVKAGMISLMAPTMKENGVKIKLMELGFCTLKMGDLNTKDNGETIYTMAGELFIPN